MSEIVKWYNGKNVLVTGATGFVGKCLVEKLLRDCTDIGDVYVMIRNKSGHDFEQRKLNYTKHIVFNHLNEHRPSALNKIQLFEGDLEAPQLGMNASNRKLIADNVSIVFHSAADVRFDRPLRIAYDINIGGTKRMLNFATEFKHLDVSNLFCCPQRRVDTTSQFLYFNVFAGICICIDGIFTNAWYYIGRTTL